MASLRDIASQRIDSGGGSGVMKSYIDVQFEQSLAASKALDSAQEQKSNPDQLTIYELPERVVTLTGEINGYKEIAANSIWEIGKRLCEAKELLGHGKWLPWLKQYVEISERSAQNFMSLYRTYPKAATVADLGTRKALLLKVLDPDERDRFIQENDVSGMTADQLKEALTERDAAREEAAALKQTLEDREQLHQKDLLRERELARLGAEEALASYRRSLSDSREEADRLGRALEKLKADKAALEGRLARAAADKKAAMEKYKALKDNAQIAPGALEAMRREAEDAAKREAEAGALGRLREIDEQLKASERALAARQAEIAALNERLDRADPAARAFEVCFGELEAYFGRIKELLEKQDEGSRARFRKALAQRLEAMAAGLG